MKCEQKLKGAFIDATCYQYSAVTMRTCDSGMFFVYI